MKGEEEKVQQWLGQKDSEVTEQLERINLKFSNSEFVSPEQKLFAQNNMAKFNTILDGDNISVKDQDNAVNAAKIEET